MPTNDEKLVNLSDLKVAYDDLDSNKVDKSGDTITGSLNITDFIKVPNIKIESRTGQSQNNYYGKLNFINIGNNKNQAFLYALPTTYTNPRISSVMTYEERQGKEISISFIPEEDYESIVLTVGEKISSLNSFHSYKVFDERDIIGIENGGTGATTATSARTNLGITPTNIGAVSTSAIIDIAHGGTGATSALGARTKLEITPGNIGAVRKTGDTLTGSLTLPSLCIKSGLYQFIYMRNANNVDISHIRGDEVAHHIAFREFTPEANGAYEDYYLPNPTNQSGAESYWIFTTKSVVDIPNGGTGAITAAGALTNLGAVAKSGDTMTGTLTINDANTTANQYAEIARFKRPAMRDNDNVMLYLGKDFTTKNCGTILYHHAGNGSDSNYLALSAYNAAQSLRSYFDGHIELSQPLGVSYGGTGATAADVARTNLGIHSGTLVTSFNNGTATVSFSTFGLNSRPNTFVATLSSTDGLIRYDWDNSASNVVLIAVHPDGTTITGIMRLSWITIP